jgi:hypothetical protein
MMNADAAALRQIATSHRDLRAQYGCRAYMTVVTFIFAGVAHRARRFFREDLKGTGKTELYTLQPYPGADAASCTEFGWYSSTTTEDFLCYAADVPVCRRDRIAAVLLDAAVTGNALAMEQDARFAALELV